MGLQLRDEGIDVHAVIFFRLCPVIEEIRHILPELLEIFIDLSSEMVVYDVLWKYLLQPGDFANILNNSMSKFVVGHELLPNIHHFYRLLDVFGPSDRRNDLRIGCGFVNIGTRVVPIDQLARCCQPVASRLLVDKLDGVTRQFVRQLRE